MILQIAFYAFSAKDCAFVYQISLFKNLEEEVVSNYSKFLLLRHLLLWLLHRNICLIGKQYNL